MEGAAQAERRRVPRATLTEVYRAGVGSILPMLMPIILFGGILTGVATPTEVSSFAVIYGLIIGAFVYRIIDLRGFIRAAIDSALLTGMILFILAAATTFSWALTSRCCRSIWWSWCKASAATAPLSSCSARSRS